MSGRKETVLDLAKFVDKGVQVKLTGGRQVTGTLKGYDQLLNLVLDEAIEFLRDSDDPLKTTDQTRSLGLIRCNHFCVRENHLDSMILGNLIWNNVALSLPKYILDRFVEEQQ